MKFQLLCFLLLYFRLDFCCGELSAAPAPAPKPTLEELKARLSTQQMVIPTNWAFSDAFLKSYDEKTIVDLLLTFENAFEIVKDVMPQMGRDVFTDVNARYYLPNKQSAIIFLAERDPSLPGFGGNWQTISNESAGSTGRTVFSLTVRASQDERLAGDDFMHLYAFVFLHRVLRPGSNTVEPAARAYIVSELASEMMGGFPELLKLRPEDLS
jgi:hypothetical protein